MSLRTSLPFATALTALLLAPLIARTDPTADARKAIQASYDHADAAVTKKDVNTAVSNRTSDYTTTGPHGETLTATQEREALTQLMKSLKSIKATTSIQAIKLKGATATVIAKEHADMFLTSPQSPKPAHLIVDDVVQDTWIKTGKGWRINHSKTLKESATQDGKPVPIL